ncbi:hypothetical protein [Christiangramia echinicola]|nr:hypothetical protein [Christiangramia echinicola]
MSQEEIKRLILKLEENHPVNEWNLYGVDLWPHIRIQLYLFLLNLGVESDKEVVLNNKTSSKEDWFKIKFRMISRFLSAIKKLHHFFKELKPKQIIFFGGHFHRTLQNGVYFNRFFDPMIAHHSLHKDIYFIEYGKVFPNSFNENAIISLHHALNSYKLLVKTRNKLSLGKNKSQARLKGYQSFYKKIQKQFPEFESLKIDESSLKKWAFKINNTKGFFLKMYRKVNPEKLLFLSYYGYDDLAAAILAAHELNLKSIDFQHGPQTNVHMAYSYWEKHPDRPYNTMPLEYWNWDINSKKNIELWANKTSLIKSKVVGHPYVTYCLNQKKDQKIDTEIFFSLQTLEIKEMLPEAIVKLIKNTNYKWVFRLHPRSNFSSVDLTDYLAENLVPNEYYVIEDALSAPLPWSLARARLHITNFSGCVIEAMMLGVPSIIIHKSGQEIFKSYFNNEKVIFLDPLDENFENEIENIMDRKTKDNPELTETQIIDPRI